MLAQTGTRISRHVHLRPSFHAFVMLMLWLLSGIAPQNVNAQSVMTQNVVSGARHSKGVIEEVRTLYPSEWNVPYPAGLAYASAEDLLYLVDRGNSGSLQAARPTVAVITPYEDAVAMVQLPVTVDNVINMAYDDTNRQLLVLETGNTHLAQFSFDEDGLLAGATHVEIAHLGLDNAEGMAVDAAKGQLLILDQGAMQIVIAKLGGTFALVSKVELKHLGVQNVRGIAVHPQRHDLFIANPSRRLLYEMAPSGEVVNRYSLAPLNLVDPRAMVFAPSADLTDDPDTIHLYLADSNVGGDEDSYGRVMELAITPADPAGNSGQCRLR